MVRDKRTVAVFDFDGTLTSKNTTLSFLRYVHPIRFYWLMPLLLPMLILYVLKLINVDKLNNWVCILFFKGKPKAYLYAKGRDFALKRLPYYMRAEALLKLKEHQKKAHQCILATATYDIYIKAWGDLHGFTEVLCTEIAYDRRGRGTGRLKGKSCYGQEKVNKIKKVLARSKPIIYAYGDSEGDKEMLNFATYSYYRRFDSRI